MSYMKPEEITDAMVERGCAAACGESWTPNNATRKSIREVLTAALCDRRVKERRAVSAKNAHTEMAEEISRQPNGDKDLDQKSASEEISADFNTGGKFCGRVRTTWGTLDPSFTDVELQPAASPERSCVGTEPASADNNNTKGLADKSRAEPASPQRSCGGGVDLGRVVNDAVQEIIRRSGTLKNNAKGRRSAFRLIKRFIAHPASDDPPDFTFEDAVARQERRVTPAKPGHCGTIFNPTENLCHYDRRRQGDRPGVAVATGESSTAKREETLRKRGEAAEERVKARLEEVFGPSPTASPKAGVQDCGAGVEPLERRKITAFTDKFRTISQGEIRAYQAPCGSWYAGKRRASDPNGLAVATPDTRIAPQDKPNTAPKSIPEVSENMVAAAGLADVPGKRPWLVGDRYIAIFRAMYSKHLEEQNHG